MHPPQLIGASYPSGREGCNKNKVFMAVDCSEARKVPIGHYFLTSEADSWWNAVQYCPWPVHEAIIRAFFEAKLQDILVLHAIVECNQHLNHGKAK